MNLAFLVPLCAAVVNGTSGLVHVAISRAPGWRVARISACIALSAASYSALASIFGIPNLELGTYLVVARATYVAAFVHACSWVIFAYGGPDASLRQLPRPFRWMCAAMLAATVVFAVTGVHLQRAVAVVDVRWAGLQYHYPLATGIGDVYGLAVVALFGVALFGLVQRYRSGERELKWHLGGFVVFVMTALDEVLVANRVIVFPSLAGFGLVLVVVPLTMSFVRRVIADAERLAKVSGQLEAQVQERTEERDQARTALVESERLAALGRLAAGVGHEINNPLAYLQLALADVQAEWPDGGGTPRVQEALAAATDGARRIQKVVEGLRSYSRRADEMALLDPADVARAALKVAWPRLRHHAQVETDVRAVPRVRGSEPALVQAIVNLLVNAAQATEGRSDGRIVLSASTAPSGSAMFVVSDNGAGMPSDVLGRLAEPYFTTRSDRGGLGLGLFITRGIVQSHGGELTYESAVGRGTTATLTIPAAANLAAEGAAEAAAPASDVARASDAARAFPPPREALRRGPAEAHGAQADRPAIEPDRPATESGPTSPSLPRLLVVDDEPMLLGMLARALRRHWTVTTATSGPEALRLLEHQAFEVIVCDLMMPGMSGMDLAAELDRRWPALRARVLFLTGGAVLPEAEAFLSRADVRHMTKPVVLGEFELRLREVAGLQQS